MSRPKNKEEYRAELADAFANILEEKGLEWKKEWRGQGGGAPHNGITKASYRGCNAFWLSLVSMMKGYDDPRWVTMVQIMDYDKISPRICLKMYRTVLWTLWERERVGRFGRMALKHVNIMY